MSKIFGFLRSCVQFIKIIIIFFVLMLLLQWIEHLLGSNWDWLNFTKPVLNIFLGIGGLISKNSINLFGALFEYKYMIALVIMVLLNFLMNYLADFLDSLEEKCNEASKTIKKIKEDRYNNQLHESNLTEQKKINKYQILVITKLKNKFSHEELGYNLDEQNTIMNKFLMEKTGITPKHFEGGFLYEFNSFEDIDDTLEIFFKLIKGKSPLNFTICVQIIGYNYDKEINQLKHLASLRFENKISTMSDTVFRYKYNTSHRYGTSQLGLFQKDGNTVEAHEFIEIL